MQPMSLLHHQWTLVLISHLPHLFLLYVKEPAPAAVTPAAKLHVNGGELCQVCKLVIEDIDQVLAENATAQDIENALEKVCSGLDLPASIVETVSLLVFILL